MLSPNGIVPVGAQKAYEYCVKHDMPRAFVDVYKRQILNILRRGIF